MYVSVHGCDRCKIGRKGMMRARFEGACGCYGSVIWELGEMVVVCGRES